MRLQSGPVTIAALNGAAAAKSFWPPRLTENPYTALTTLDPEQAALKNPEPIKPVGTRETKCVNMGARVWVRDRLISLAFIPAILAAVVPAWLL